MKHTKRISRIPARAIELPESHTPMFFLEHLPQIVVGLQALIWDHLKAFISPDDPPAE
jgi:hypothetical protein